MQLLQIHEPGQTPAPHAGEGELAVGIDLGTTHSVVAAARGGQAEVIRDICGEALVPSIVWYGDGVRETGRAARARWQHGEAGSVASIKRLMGRSAAEAGDIYPVVNKNAPGMARLLIAGRELTPVEISADILRHMKSQAEEALGQPVGKAVITVPAYFDEGARQATKDAARLAGLEVLRLINEPTAAALAYGLDSGAEGIYAVYDLGGGTFDISLLRLEKGVFQVLSTGGDAQLGGDDFDHAVLADALTQSGLTLPAHSPERGRLLAQIRRVREQLSEAEEVPLTLALEGHTAHLTLTREHLQALIAPLVERTLAACGQALWDAGVEASAIHGVVLVGGATRTPLVRARVAEFFGQEPLCEVNPDEVVAIGAALQAEALTKGSDTLLLDVIPLALGLETMGGLVEKIIPRNTPIPVTAGQEFTTYKDGQGGMAIHVLQGERELVDQNRSLARFELTGIPPLPAGIARVLVTFAVDADGLLTVSAQEGMTGVAQTVSVKPSYGLEIEDIERMLRESMEHARADITERLLAESKFEAERLLEELASARAADEALLSAQEIEAIGHATAELREALQTRDRDAIDAAAQALNEAARPFAERRMDKAIAAALKGKSVGEV